MRHVRTTRQSIMIQFLTFLLTGAVLIAGCSSPPAPSPEPSKREIRQDADGFFKKMEQEEAKPSKP